MSLPMDVDLLGGIGFSTTNTQNFVVNQTNILSESCVFGNVSNQAVANHTAVAVEATIQVAGERHSIVVNTHHYEMEDARQNARVAQETNKQLQELVLRLQDKANADSARVDRLRDRLQNKATADSARVDRLRELEIAFDIQNNEIVTMKREREASALSAQARASAWAAAHPVSSSSGEGNHFQELSSGGTAGRLAQPGRLESLAHSQDSVGYVKGAPSEPTTTCDTAGGHGGSESSASDNRFLFPIDLTSRNQEKSLARPLSPVNSERTAATEQSGPRHVSLTATQTVTAPTKTVQGDNRKPSPSKPGAASSSKDHANRKGDKKDRKDKKKKKADDDEDDKDKDEGRSKRNSTGQPGGGKKDPDDSDDSDGSKDSNPPPPPFRPWLSRGLGRWVWRGHRTLQTTP
mgnify:CR=1 FL=1